MAQAKTLSRLRASTRAAAFTEYVVLTSLLGATVIGIVFGLGSSIRDNNADATARIETALDLDLAQSGPGTGGNSGGGTPPAPTPPAVDPFASCEASYGPNPAAIRGNGDGSALVGGNESQIFYALPDALVDGGEGGVDADLLLVPGAGAVASFDLVNPESGRVDFPDGGAVVFSNIETVVLCDEGGEVVPPSFVLTGIGTPTPDRSFNAIHLGPTVDFDPVEGNWIAEGAAVLLGASFGSSSSPLHLSVVKAYEQQDPGNSEPSIWADNGGWPEEGYLIEGGVFDGSTLMLDNALAANATVEYIDGTTATAPFFFVLLKNGADRQLFLFQPWPVGAGPQLSILGAAPVQNITINSLVSQGTSGGLGLQTDLQLWVLDN